MANKIVTSGNRPLFFATWGGFKTVPSAGYVYESDEFTGNCIAIVVEGAEVTEQLFKQSDDAIGFVANLMKLKASPVQVPDDSEAFLSEQGSWYEPIE